MSSINRRVAFSCLSILFGYMIFGTYALSLRFAFPFPIEAYYLSFVFASIPLLFEAATWKSSGKLRLLYLLSFSLMIHLQFAVVDSSPLLSSVDAVADYRLTDKIIGDSRWMPQASIDWGFGSEYRYYPVSNFLYAATSLLTGIPLLIIVKYLFVIKALIVTPLVERFFSGFFSQRVAYLATIIFLASPGAILFPHKEAFGVIFFFLSIYALTRPKITRRFLLIGLFSTMILTMTHHFTTYIFLALITSLFLANHLFKSRNTIHVSSQFFILCWVIFVGWVTYIAWTTIATHQRQLSEMILGALFPGKLTFSELLPFYNSYERIIIWIGAGITAFSAGIGFLIYVRKKYSSSPSFLAIALFLFPVLAFASFLRFFPSSNLGFDVVVSHRAFEFGYIIIGAFSALFFIKASKSRRKSFIIGTLVSAIIFMILCGPILGALHPRSYTRVNKVISFETISLNNWISESIPQDEYAIGDSFVTLMLVYGNFTSLPFPELFANQDVSLSWNPNDPLSRAGYVITYIYMKDIYGLNSAKFDNSSFFCNLYTNGMFNLYGIRNHVASQIVSSVPGVQS